MIRYYNGTVFNVNAQALVNTVNCVGAMGAGLALEFKLRYPDMFADYAAKCKSKQMETGKVYYFRNPGGPIIVNFPTKAHFKYPSKLVWVEQGLKHFAATYADYGITSIAFPKLGTQHGGLNWPEVQRLMEEYLSGLSAHVYICLDEKKEADGVEKVMLEAFNATNIERLASSVRLTSKQEDSLRNTMPYSRFWHIGKTETIGAATYSALFTHFYQLATAKPKGPSQLSLFDDPESSQ